MRVTVFGASGPTGRLLTRQLIGQGHDVVAVTRRPDGFRVSGEQLRVVAADATSYDDVVAACAGAEAVVSVLGTAFSREPVDLYSKSAEAISTAMSEGGTQRLIVTSSAALSDWTDPGWSRLQRVVGRRVLGYLGRTLYADMARMEAIVSATDLNWTIMRPLGLANLDAPTAYCVAEDHIAGRQTARHDLAAAIADQLARADFHRKTAAVATTTRRPRGLARTLWREGIRPALQTKPDVRPFK